VGVGDANHSSGRQLRGIEQFCCAVTRRDY